MGSMQVVRGLGGSISIGDRSYTKTGMEPVVFIPAYKTLSGTVWHYWAVLGRSKGAAAGTVSTPEYTAEYNLTVNGRQVYVLTLDNGAFENGTLTISGPGTIPATIQTGAAGQWYELVSMTADNSALQEAELLLRAAKQKQVAPRAPGGGSAWKYDRYLLVWIQYQGGYGNGPIEEHFSCVLVDGKSRSDPSALDGGPKIENPMGYAGMSADINMSNEGLLTIHDNQHQVYNRVTAMRNILCVYGQYKGQTFTAGTDFYLYSGLHVFVAQ